MSKQRVKQKSKQNANDIKQKMKLLQNNINIQPIINGNS